MTNIYQGDQIIVIDNGSSTIKAGFSGDDTPRVIFPSIIGHSRIPTSISAPANNGQNLRVYVGDEVLCQRGILSIKSVFPTTDNTIITNWDDMEKLWNHTFNELHVNPSEYAVMLTESSVNPKENKEKMIEIMFETFKTEATHIANQAVLSLNAHGKTTGIVLESSHNATHVVPIHNGKPIKNAITSVNFAGRQLSKYLNELLLNRDYSFTTVSELEIVRDIKETLSYVSLDFESEMKSDSLSPLEKLYELPDGQIINIGTDSFNCTEPLFKPSLFRVESKGIHQVLYDSIMKCDTGIHDDLFSNILLSGGTTLIPGIIDRLNKELNSLVPLSSPTKINISAPSNRKHSAWIGGSRLTAVNTFRPEWITKEQYEEHGLSII